jgi:DNA-binding CsgD family transcriptional regulator
MTERLQIARNAVRATQRVMGLPAIATQDWLRHCAEALCCLSDHAAVLTLVCTTQADDDRISVLSTGVGFAPNAAPQGSRTQLAITLQDRSERMTRLGLALPEHAQRRGLVAPMQSIDAAWASSPLARAFASTQFTTPLMYLLPIESEKHKLMLISVIGLSQSAEKKESRESLQLLGALHEPLCTRASAALARVDNPRAWLTDREQSVLELLIEGLSVRVIAEKLGRSTHTIHDHVKNLHRKIGASSRGELIAMALGYEKNMQTCACPNPISLPFPGESYAELKPAQTIARPLHS